ncbi:hypothetical protein DERP_008146 [Dermatophagoides pteronyssinus]|uniref:Uncharacterized protein n=1 Tax=Dermatophagoides pteronyssinus TaxID=6956 RepID=A0ABQ8JKB3_DERPT|nr:hypothetical protein DERP_008146 [Dermatophagoides pteronyssinus]
MPRKYVYDVGCRKEANSSSVHFIFYVAMEIIGGTQRQPKSNFWCVSEMNEKQKINNPTISLSTRYKQQNSDGFHNHQPGD